MVQQDWSYLTAKQSAKWCSMERQLTIVNWRNLHFHCLVVLQENERRCYPVGGLQERAREGQREEEKEKGKNGGGERRKEGGVRGKRGKEERGEEQREETGQGKKRLADHSMWVNPSHCHQLLSLLPNVIHVGICYVQSKYRLGQSVDGPVETSDLSFV